MQKVRRGDIYYADLDPVIGSEQGGVRPVVVLQNDVGNKYSPTIIAAAITSNLNKNRMPTHVRVSNDKDLPLDSVVLLEQLRTIDKKRLQQRVGHFPDETMREIDRALSVSIGLAPLR
ncbi:MAG: type II toxin-antitoxin system PemK/MazF family toxin [Peptoniphilaceae bacterium]|nr:type II toxin-antitoxin system PemK/MazF family toxin [Peptoniphilaceae bacterium]MDY6086260.1 type II toxin-antitoxin system PemK/MazF family toxin [Peptoniphilaceae bacterium]